MTVAPVGIATPRRGWSGAIAGCLVALALLDGCRGDDAPGRAESRSARSSDERASAPAASGSGSAGSSDERASAPAASGSGSAGGADAGASPASPVPRLPPSPDGAAEVAALDRRIELHRDEPGLEIVLLLERAWIGGRLEDYVEALRRSKAWVVKAPSLRRAWQTRAQVLTRVHELAQARAVLARLRAPGGSAPGFPRGGSAHGFPRRGYDPSELEGLMATIDELRGAPSAAAYRERMAREYPDQTTLTQWAASLAAAGRTAEALEVMQRVPPLIHDNAPELLAWILFQWGRIYELRAEMAAARSFFEAARARLPTVEATVHLARAIAATGGDPRPLVTEALATSRHPDLLALAGEVDEARRAWERYVAALPRAFAEHAARFYLGPGKDPARALALARLVLANRPTGEARSLVVEAAIAAGEPATACALAPPLVAGTEAQQFMAWRAFSACHRADEAAALAARLGIRPPVHFLPSAPRSAH